MASKQRIKIFQRALARHGLYGSSWLITKLPYKLMRAITYLFIGIGFCFAVKQRRIAYDSLRIAFGEEKDKKQINSITRECFTNVGKAMIELIYFMEHPEFIKKEVFFEGKKHIDEALRQGNGAIGVSAHFGNFPLMLLRCAKEGYKVNAIIRSTRDKELEEYFQKKRKSLGLNTIYSHPRKECVDVSLKALRNNEFLFIPLDQNFGSGGGVFVDFFGQKAATATGPVVFAMRTGAPILPIFAIRQKDDSHKIIIESPIEIEKRNDDKETILVNTARITKIIEQYIRKYPQEWGWMHRRWKSRPKGEK